MKFLITDPTSYRRRRDGGNVRVHQVPPLGAAYIAAVLKKYGDVTFADASCHSLRELNSLFSRHYDYILFSVSSASYSDACAMARDFPAADQTRIVLGGPHVSIEREGVFSSGPWRLAVMGEGEQVCRHILKNHESTASVPAFPGLLRRGVAGFVPPERICDLDSLDWPDFSSFPMNNYEYHAVITSRGCPFSCSFCAIQAVWGKRWFCRSVEDVVEEMSRTAADYGKKIFHINDDNFTLRPERVEDFCKKLRKKNKGFRWIAQGVRADKVTRNLLCLMRKSGCERISIGVESADPGVLKAIGKHESVEQIRRAIWMARDAGIDVLSMFVIGTSAETPESIAKSFSFVEKNSLYPVDFYQLVPYPGTKEWDLIQGGCGKMLVDDYREFEHYSEEPVFETPSFTAADRKRAFAQARELSRKMERKWYVRRHLRFFAPHIILRHTAGDVFKELLFFTRLPSRIIRRFARLIANRRKHGCT